LDCLHPFYPICAPVCFTIISCISSHLFNFVHVFHLFLSISFISKILKKIPKICCNFILFLC
jgi:hypothetical protein